MSRTIHVVCGDSVAGSLNEGFSISWRDIVSLRDDLSFGPLAAVDNLESWWTTRQAYWQHLEREPANTKKRRRRVTFVTRDYIFGDANRLADADEVMLWLGTGLADQLVLAWMPQFLRATGGRTETLRVVQFVRTNARATLHTLALVSGDEFQERPDPRPIDGAGYAYLDRAWSAVTSSDPAELIRFLDYSPSPLPIFRAALNRMLWRYPDIGSGINRYETRLLASTQDDGPVVARVIGSTMEAFFFEENECVGDNWLFWRLQRLADPKLPHPAVALTGKRTTIAGTEARMTLEGERFLKAESNFAKLNGIDDWVGGVHLDSQVGDVWFRQDNRIIHG